MRAEFEATFRKAAEERGDDYDTLTLQEKLERTPLSVWEGEFPIYDKVLDETLRILMISLIFRRKLRTASKVTQTTTTIAGSEVQDREFVSFWLGAAHRNSTIYSEPLKFDPTRFERGEGKKEGEFCTLGQRKACVLGMRFAKLEIKTVHAAFSSPSPIPPPPTERASRLPMEICPFRTRKANTEGTPSNPSPSRTTQTPCAPSIRRTSFHPVPLRVVSLRTAMPTVQPWLELAVLSACSPLLCARPSST